MIFAKKKIFIKSLNTLMVQHRVLMILWTIFTGSQRVEGVQGVTCRVPTRDTKPPPPPKLRGKKDVMPGKRMKGGRVQKKKKKLKGQRTEEKRKQGETDRQGLF